MLNNFNRQAAPFIQIHTHPGGRRMRISRLHFSIVVLAALMLLASCCGSSSGLLSEKSSSGDTFIGVQDGDFKVVRYNDDGYRDSALNPTLGLQTTTSGDTTRVVVAIDDLSPAYGVAMDLHYDASQYTPVSVEFSGLVEDPIELSVVKSEYVALAQVSLDGESSRSGEFVAVTFLNEPSKTISASGDAHHVAVDRIYNASQLSEANYCQGFVLTKATAETDSPATATIRSTFAIADGNQDSESNTGDITSLISRGWFGSTVSDTNFAPAVVDYELNGEVNAGELTYLSLYLGEQTSKIDILLGDTDTFATTDTAAFSIAWDDGEYTSPAPSVAQTDWSAVFTTWDVDITLAQLQAADTNSDGTVYISARTANDDGGAVGPAFTGQAITYVSINSDFTISDFDAEIVGTTTTAVANEGTLNVLANDPLTLNVTGIYGTYQGTDFTPADRGTVVPATDYDDTMADIAETITWTAELDEDMIATTEGVFTDTSVTGTAQSVMVFPDDDPDYGTGMPEGRLTVTMPGIAGQVTEVINVMSVNVDTDPDVPVFTEFWADQGQVEGGTNWYLNSAGETVILASFAYGTIVVAEADFVDMQLQLFNLDDGDNYNFTIVESTALLDAGQADVKADSEHAGQFVVSAIVGTGVVPGTHYALRLAVPDGEDMKWSSINKPGDEFFEVAPLPEPVEFVTMPSSSEIGPDIDELWIYYPDPRIRRNPVVDFQSNTLVPDDEDAYLDILKQSGTDFALTQLGSPDDTEPGGIFPEVILIEGSSATDITSSTTSYPGVSVIARTPNYIVVDIGVLTQASTTSTTYAFKVFGAADDQANWPTLGTGTFVVAAMTIDPAAVEGVDFGINIFDDTERGDLELASRDYTNKILNASTIGTTEPDVLFVEFNGGRSDDYLGTDNTNVEIVFEDTATSATMSTDMSIRVVGIGTNGLNRLAIHDFTAEDFDDPLDPSSGILDPGSTFNLILNSPLQAGTDDYTFSVVLTVTGTNPND